MAYLVESAGLLWDDLETALKAHLGIADASQDALLKRLLMAAKRAGDQYMDRDFEDDEGVDIVFDVDSEDDDYLPVIQGLFEWVRIAMEKQTQPHGVNMVKTDALQESYSATARAEAITDVIADEFWVTYKSNMLF